MTTEEERFVRSGPLRLWTGRSGDPEAPTLIRHLMESAALPRRTREENVAAHLATLRVLHGDLLPFDERAARRYAETSYDRAVDPAAATNHDLAGRRWTPDRLAPLTSISAPTLVVHGTADPLLPLPHGEALATGIPEARLHVVPGMGHSLYAPGLPARIAELVLEHTGNA